MQTAIGAVAVILLIVYVVLPLIFRYSPAFQRQLVFLPYNLLADGVRWSAVNYEQPQVHGLKGARNLYIKTEPDVRVGVWHILPKSLLSKSVQEFQNSLASGHPIVLYIHGNSGSRATRHRVEMYQLLQSLDYHVLTLDYRGFAESSPVLMSEDGAVTDASKVLEYIRKFSQNSTVIVWGHSLGSGVAIKLVAQLCILKHQPPDRLVLESAFDNLRDVFRNHPLTKIYRLLSFADRFFTERLVTNNVAFDSQIHIVHIECPILMLHARDDPIVSICQAKKLYQAGIQSRPVNWPPLKLIEFHQDLGYLHEYICRAPELPSIIGQFVDSAAERKPVIV